MYSVETVLDEADHELWVSCAACRRAFQSGIFMDPSSFEEKEFSGRLHECPFCSYTAAYGKMDYTYDGG